MTEALLRAVRQSALESSAGTGQYAIHADRSPGYAQICSAVQFQWIVARAYGELLLQISCVALFALTSGDGMCAASAFAMQQAAPLGQGRRSHQ